MEGLYMAPLLFEPIQIRDVMLKNRVVVAPMHQYAAVEGFATDWHLMNAGRYAAGGAGLVIMESTKVERRGCGTVGDLGIWETTSCLASSAASSSSATRARWPASSSVIRAARRGATGRGRAARRSSPRPTSGTGKAGSLFHPVHAMRRKPIRRRGP